MLPLAVQVLEVMVTLTIWADRPLIAGVVAPVDQRYEVAMPPSRLADAVPLFFAAVSSVLVTMAFRFLVLQLGS